MLNLKNLPFFPLKYCTFKLKGDSIPGGNLPASSVLAAARLAHQLPSGPQTGVNIQVAVTETAGEQLRGTRRLKINMVIDHPSMTHWLIF